VGAGHERTVVPADKVVAISCLPPNRPRAASGCGTAKNSTRRTVRGFQIAFEFQNDVVEKPACDGVCGLSFQYSISHELLAKFSASFFLIISHIAAYERLTNISS
jgi:hypothetical protein